MYALIEVKLTDNGIVQSEKNLLQLLDLIREHNLNVKKESEKIAEPDFLMIITGACKIAYTTSNNVLVVPIDCLKD